MPLYARLLLAAIPALYSLLALLFLSPVFPWPGPYMWHPEFIDVLFGLLVLGPFTRPGPFRWPRIVMLVVASVVIHHLAVAAVFHSQNPFAPAIDLRFVSVAPVAVLATLAIGAAVRWMAPLRASRHFWAWLAASGLASGLLFFLLLEFDASMISEARLLLAWLFWHVTMCAALFLGSDAAGGAGRPRP